MEDTEAMEAAVKAALQKFGKIDILVHCAGIRGPVGVPVVEGDAAEWRRIFEINSIGAFVVSKAVAKDMIRRNQGGKIVHIASAAGKLGAPGSAAYAASKWAVIGLVQSLALELAKYKINVNAINPGFFSTNLRDDDAVATGKRTGKTPDEYREEESKKITPMVPLGRMGEVEDIAKVIFFLVSDQSDYMTGQAINITGGTLMHSRAGLPGGMCGHAPDQVKTTKGVLFHEGTVWLMFVDLSSGQVREEELTEERHREGAPRQVGSGPSCEIAAGDDREVTT